MLPITLAKFLYINVVTIKIVFFVDGVFDGVADFIYNELVNETAGEIANLFGVVDVPLVYLGSNPSPL